MEITPIGKYRYLAGYPDLYWESSFYNIQWNERLETIQILINSFGNLKWINIKEEDITCFPPFIPADRNDSGQKG